MADHRDSLKNTGIAGARAITALLAGGAGFITIPKAVKLMRERMGLSGDDNFPDDPAGGGTGDFIVVEYIKDTSDKTSEFIAVNALPIEVVGLVMIISGGVLWATKGSGGAQTSAA